MAAETLHRRVDVSSGQIITFLVGAEGFCLVGVVMGGEGGQVRNTRFTAP